MPRHSDALFEGQAQLLTVVMLLRFQPAPYIHESGVRHLQLGHERWDIAAGFDGRGQILHLAFQILALCFVRWTIRVVRDEHGAEYRLDEHRLQDLPLDDVQDAIVCLRDR